MDDWTKKMEEKVINKPIIQSDRFDNVLKALSKCKIDYFNDKEECKKLREWNSKLEIELKEARELEKSHRYHLSASREMIGNLQDTVSQLVYLKRDVKKLKDELVLRDTNIAALEKEKESLLLKHNDQLKELQIVEEKHIEELTASHQKQIQQVQHDADTQLAQFTCVIEELRSKIKDMDNENRDKMNVVVLEYEEKLQRGAALVTQLQDQLARQAARTDANIDAYRRRLEELEEKLKQSQFKQYLAQTSTPYESQVERPYSVERDYADVPVDLDPVLDTQRQQGNVYQNKAPKHSNSLQVMYYGNKTGNVQKNERKGEFNISKKRKLYSDKEF